MKNKTDAKLWEVFSLFIRLRDTNVDGNGKCFTCPRILYFREGDCGHGIGRQHKATKYNEFNNKFQCKKCNGFEEGRKDVFKECVDKVHGKGTWDMIQLSSRNVCKRTSFEIDAMTKYYAQEVEKLLQNKNTEIRTDVLKQIKKYL